MPPVLSRHAVACLQQEFGRVQVATTSHEHLGLIFEDFAALLREEYDVPDSTMTDGIGEENTITAAREYRRRIGSGNLAAYGRTLAAGRDSITA